MGPSYDRRDAPPQRLRRRRSRCSQGMLAPARCGLAPRHLAARGQTRAGPKWMFRSYEKPGVLRHPGFRRKDSRRNSESGHASLPSIYRLQVRRSRIRGCVATDLPALSEHKLEVALDDGAWSFPSGAAVIRVARPATSLYPGRLQAAVRTDDALVRLVAKPKLLHVTSSTRSEPLRGRSCRETSPCR
jgi:hypothetical protein